MLGPTHTLEKLQQKNTEVSGLGEVQDMLALVLMDSLIHW